ncbi:polysaccharide deacetylase family protein [Streptococcus halotolerans]|uniref:polysaccharide deacetylase family protein n=1 Tax=Streptococcus halotolerans TaxID=1814128 RepID=UPI000787A381|nr:polysaccharide deacetylase family protein [Streptococcus halotolerans]
MKKIVLVLGFVAAVLSLVWFMGKSFYVQQRQEKIMTFVEDFQKEINREIPISNGQEVWRHKESWIYFNTGGEGSYVQKKLEEFMPEKNQLGQYDNHDINHLHLLYPKKVASDLEHVSELQLKKSSYKIDWFDIKKEKKTNLKSLYFKDGAYKDPFTLNDLIKDKAAFRKVIETTAQDKSWSQDRKETILKPFESDDWSEIPFSYKKDQLVLTKDLSLPINRFLDSVQGKYLKGDALKTYQAYVAKNRQNLKRVALTFDDGPNPATTPKVVDILKRYNAKATFFTIGQKIAGQEELLKKMVDQGNEIGNHTWTHPNLTTLSGEAVKQEINDTNAAIEKAIKQKPTLMRPPYGATNTMVQSAAGMKEVMWTVDTLDWQSHSTPAIMKKVQEQLKPGGIILMHDIHQTSVDALPSVLEYLKSQGYEVVTVSELNGY